MDQAHKFWDSYKRVAELEDREFVKGLSATLDAHLIFAGLFSAVNTTLIVESLKKVQADHPETTNQLIRAVVPILTHAPISNETSSLLLKDSFSAKPHDIRSTALFFVSLCCSLTAAFGAVLAKQWLTYYERQGGLKTPPDRARERQRKYEGRRDWYLEGIIETLPTILQLSLLLFLVALINFLWHIHPTVRFITMGFSLVPALFYLFTTTASIFNPNAPFQTRLSIFLRTHFPKLWAHFKTLPIPSNKLTKTWSWLKNIIFGLSVPWITRFWPETSSTDVPKTSDLLNLNCLIFYMRKSLKNPNVKAVYEAMDALPLDLPIDRSHQIIVSLIEATFAFLFKPSWDAELSKLVWGTSNIEFRPLLKLFHLLYVHWDYKPNDDRNNPLNNFLNYKVECEIRDEIWNVLVLGISGPKKLDINSVSLIADIFGARFRGQPSAAIDPQILLPQLSSPPETENLPDTNTAYTQIARDRLPYIKLFASVLPYKDLNVIKQSDKHPIIQALISSMGENDMMDLDYTTGLLRVDLLPTRLQDNKDKQYFSKYILNWARNAQSRKFESNHHDVTSKYLKAICMLLSLSPEGFSWSNQLERDGHASYLLQIVQLYLSVLKRPDTSNHQQVSLIVQAAVYGFTTLWRVGNPPDQIEESSPLYLDRGSVKSIAEFWVVLGSYDPSTLEMFGIEMLAENQVLRMMEDTVSYFQQAHRKARVDKQDMAEAVKGYRQAGVVISKSYRAQFERLCRRMDRLRG